MRNLVLVTICFLFYFVVSAQELNCKVTINSDQLSQGDLPVFKTLERSLNDFVNKSKWSNRTFKESEQINAQMFITITKYESNRFEGTIQIQSSRPVYNTSYETPVFNFKDNNLTFEYIEFQPLVFNVNVFDSNLVAVVAYYANIILGLDADTFTLEGGTEYFVNAQKITTQGQSSGYKGWDSTEKRSRFLLIDDLLSNTYRKYRLASYSYHRKGLDILADDNTAKQILLGAIQLFGTMEQRQTNSFLIQTFFDAKSDEIKDIFSDGPKVDVVKLKETLSKVAPSYSSTWNDIKY